MSSTDLSPPAGLRRLDQPSFAGRIWAGLNDAVAWLDGHGRKAWIATVVASFVIAPPLGVAALLFAIGTGRMFSRNHDRFGGCASRRARRDAWANARTAMRPSGNTAFDAYKAETLRRLEDEQRAFEDFLARLREAKDKAEFDQFMEERARRAKPGHDDEQDAA
ncbi:DUF2852 domain-containing protein [Rubellimicrobium roseum]|uniref:DUF2852 domain-containing protein n=1 Tax=Rubellimicrobium roseum TaxID=687525 RepID=A0A5C4NLU0_9RHOB|nr:DUF2852 domain-containing protein [Rubellimicrobium roseum]TNC73379.1 DUF2852 domain-containing protein [Rubellimicrobium roseum]